MRWQLVRRAQILWTSQQVCGRQLPYRHVLSRTVSTGDGSVRSSASSGSSSTASSSSKLKIKKSAAGKVDHAAVDAANAKNPSAVKAASKSNEEKHHHHISSAEKHRYHKHSSSAKTHSHHHSSSHKKSRSNTHQQRILAAQQAKFATKVGALANMAMAIAKGVVGFSIHSTGLIADAANNLGDLLCDAVVYFSVTEARKVATPDRPWGRGKAEPLGALSVAGLLFATGAGIGYSALLAGLDIAAASHLIPSYYVELIHSGELLETILEQFYNYVAGSGDASAALDNSTIAAPVDGRGNDVDRKRLMKVAADADLNAQYVALAVAGASVLAKEALFRYTLQAGTAANSDAVIANAWQHRADVTISLAVLAGLIGSMNGYPILDPIAGMLVAGIIARQGLATARDALIDLSDAPADAKETAVLKHTILGINGVLSVEDIKARKSGPYLYVEVTVGVDGNISASAAHRLAELTRLELLSHHKGRVANVVVHVTPLGSAGLGEQSPHWARDHDFIVSVIKEATMEVEEVMAVTEVQVYYKDNGEIAAKLDIVLQSNLTIQRAHWIAVKARRKIMRVLPGMEDIDVDLELDEVEVDMAALEEEEANEKSKKDKQSELAVDGSTEK